MRFKDSIGIFIISLILLAGISAIYETSYNYMRNKFLSGHQQEMITAEMTGAKGNAGAEKAYYLTEENGYIVIYRSDRKTVYETTSIKTDSLPEKIRQELQTFKKFPDQKSLYGFLENYSS